MNDSETTQRRIVPFPAVNAAIFDEKRRLLLTRRSSQIREGGKWCLPGGHVDGGEDYATAMRREVLEETGLVVKRQSLLGIYSDPKLTVTERVLKEGYFAHFLVVLFLVHEFEGQLKENSEVDAFEWVGPGELPSPIVRSHPVRIQDAFNFQGEVFVR